MPDFWWIPVGLVVWILGGFGVGYILGKVIHNGQRDDA